MVPQLSSDRECWDSSSASYLSHDQGCCALQGILWSVHPPAHDIFNLCILIEQFIPLWFTVILSYLDLNLPFQSSVRISFTHFMPFF